MLTSLVFSLVSTFWTLLGSQAVRLCKATLQELETRLSARSVEAVVRTHAQLTSSGSDQVKAKATTRHGQSMAAVPT